MATRRPRGTSPLFPGAQAPDAHPSTTAVAAPDPLGGFAGGGNLMQAPAQAAPAFDPFAGIAAPAPTVVVNGATIPQGGVNMSVAAQAPGTPIPGLDALGHFPKVQPPYAASSGLDTSVLLSHIDQIGGNVITAITNLAKIVEGQNHAQELKAEAVSKSILAHIEAGVKKVLEGTAAAAKIVVETLAAQDEVPVHPQYAPAPQHTPASVMATAIPHTHKGETAQRATSPEQDAIVAIIVPALVARRQQNLQMGQPLNLVSSPQVWQALSQVGAQKGLVVDPHAVEAAFVAAGRVDAQGTLQF